MRANLRETTHPRGLWAPGPLLALLAGAWGATVLGLSWASPAGALERPDSWITIKVKISLAAAEGVDGSDLDVDTSDGRVTLFGRADSPAEKQRAEEQALGISGVRQVRNLVRVLPPGKEEAIAARDAELGRRVATALAEEPELGDSRIGVESVVDGLVLLSGHAASASDHRRALETARGLPGVADVATLIESPDARTDAELWKEGWAEPGFGKDLYITTAAKLRLFANDATPVREVDVDSRAGVVTLFGMVPSQTARAVAESEVRQVRWVRAVENKLQVVRPEQKQRVAAEDGAIRATVESALDSLKERSSIDTSKIDVDVSNRVVRLRGTVASQKARVAAVATASASPGVHAVEDELRVGTAPAG